MKVKFRPIDLRNNSFEQAVLESHGLDLNWAFADETQILDGLGLRNMDKAVKMLEKHIAKNSTIGILVDSDFDGYSSASIMYRWLKRKNPDLKITFFIQEGKVHGIMPRMFDDVELDFLIIPDAGSAQIEEHCALHSRGWDILILDHHEMGDESPYAVTINPHNPLCNYPNKSLSGGGVTWKTIAEFDKQCGSEDYKDFLDMVACSIVADVMSTKTMENKAIINLGMKNIVSSYIKANFEADGRLQDKSFDPTTISFYIAPVINAVTRVGTLEEKTMMFEAMAEIGNPMSTIPKLILAKGRQDRAKEKPYIRVLYNLQKQEKEHHKALICTAPVNLARSTTGLVAGQLSGAYNRPVMLLHDREDGVCVGSLRSPNNCNVSDFKGFLEESGLCNWVAGHASAAGVSINKENIPALEEYIAKNLPEPESAYDVTVDLREIHDIVEAAVGMKNLEKHFATDFKDVFVYAEFEVQGGDIDYIGAKSDTLRINGPGFDLIKFRSKDQDKLSASFGWVSSKGKTAPKARLMVVGELTVNEWNGKIKPQMKIKDFEVVLLEEEDQVESIDKNTSSLEKYKALGL